MNNNKWQRGTPYSRHGGHPLPERVEHRSVLDSLYWWNCHPSSVSERRWHTDGARRRALQRRSGEGWPMVEVGRRKSVVFEQGKVAGGLAQIIRCSGCICQQSSTYADLHV